MQVKNVMSKHVECVLASDTLSSAADKMKGNEVGALPVIDNGEPVGVITDRDLVLRGLAPGQDPSVAKVSEIATDEVTWCEEDDELERAGDVMARKRLRRLLVRDKQGKLSGILSLGDIAREPSARDLAGRVLASVSERT